MVSGKRPILKEEFEDTKSEPVNQRRTDNTMTKKKDKRANNDLQKQTVEIVPTVCYYLFFFFSY
jgi:hypothetical protein